MIIKPANRTNSVSEYYFSKKLQEIDLMNRQGAEVINLESVPLTGCHPRKLF